MLPISTIHAMHVRIPISYYNESINSMLIIQFIRSVQVIYAFGLAIIIFCQMQTHACLYIEEHNFEFHNYVSVLFYIG